MLKVTIEQSGDTAILHCTGRIVRGEESAILCAAVQQPGRWIVLDLTDVESIDAAGVGALISLQAAGIYVQLLKPNRAVQTVLRVRRLDTIFEIDTTPLRPAEAYPIIPCFSPA